MVPFLTDESQARSWAQQQRASSLRDGGRGVVMHVMRDSGGRIWVIADHERERFAAIAGAQASMVCSVSGDVAP